MLGNRDISSLVDADFKYVFHNCYCVCLKEVVGKISIFIFILPTLFLSFQLVFLL